MIDESSDFSESQSRMRATRMAHLSQGQSPSSQLKITLDTGSRYNILDEQEALNRGWKVNKLTEWEEPSLRYADGRKMPISGKVSLWIRLNKDQNKRKVDLFVTPNLRSKMIIGLIDLKRLGWTTPQWPLDIERWQSLFQSPPADDESEDDVVNNINDDDAQGEEVTMEKADKEEGHEEEEEEDDDDEEQRANLRESADKLLDKLEQGGLIKKAPRVNSLLERPTHPQFSVEQLIQQVPSSAILCKRGHKEGTSPVSSHTGDFLGTTHTPPPPPHTIT